MLLWGGNMKWSIQELNKFRLTNNTFDYTTDLSSFVNEDFVDFIRMSLVSVKGSYQVLSAFDEYVFEVHVECILTMACAITLQPVDVPISFDTSLSFATTPIDDSVYLIEGNTVDLDKVIWANILIEKPMRVIAEDAYDHYQEDIVTLDESELQAVNPFSKIKP